MASERSDGGGAKIGVDVGGTFTDLYAFDRAGGRNLLAKVPSTPDDFTRGVLGAIAAAGLDLGRVDHVVHGTTIATNTMVERTYPVTPFVTTEGFRDLTLIGRYHRPSLYDPYQQKPAPLARRRHIFEARERIGSRGQVLEPLDEAQAREIAQAVRALGAASVAVGLLNSYANDAHERRIAEIIEQASPGIFVSLSSAIPKFRALGRFTTALVRAALQPVVKTYLETLTRRLGESGFRGRLLIVTNNGGMIDAEMAHRRPELMLTSGPASGVNAGLFINGLVDKANTITMDMGGTSNDVSIIEDGRPLVTTDFEIAWDRPVAVPMLDIRTIGAGGGSIAWIDDGGSLRVGPRSAGSVPGPACYGRGGEQPTVTDANLILGRLSRSRVYGNEISLDPEASEKVLRPLADRLGLDLVATAAGIVTIVNENMAASLKEISLDRGRDPRDFSLVAYGGGGPMHAVFLAEALGLKTVIVPNNSGVLSALGAVVMDFRSDAERTFYAPAAGVELDALTRELEDLDAQVRGALEAQNVPDERIELVRTAQMRYIGQTYEVDTPVPNGPIDADGLATILDQFHRAHEREYGVANETLPAAFVNLRSTAHGAVEKVRIEAACANGGDPEAARVERREVYFPDRGYVATAVFDRDRLPVGAAFTGPAVIEDASSTTVVPPGRDAEKDSFGNIIVSIG